MGKKSKRLTTIWLSSNKIGDLGAAALGAALHTEPFSEIILSSNVVGPSGASALAAALRANRTLTVLNLFQNQLGDSGAAALAEALKGNALVHAGCCAWCPFLCSLCLFVPGAMLRRDMSGCPSSFRPLLSLLCPLYLMKVHSNCLVVVVVVVDLFRLRLFLLVLFLF